MTLFSTFQGKTLCENLGDTCYMNTVDGDVVSRREEPGLYSNHEEADLRIYIMLLSRLLSTGSTTKGAILSSEQVMLTVSFPLAA